MSGCVYILSSLIRIFPEKGVNVVINLIHRDELKSC